MSLITVRMLQRADHAAFVAHLSLHMLESGRDGSPHFAPQGRSMDWGARLKGRDERWEYPLDRVEWERVWGAFDDGHLIGHVDLRAGSLPASLHRASLGLGLMQPYRGKGLGRRLMETSLDWARAQPGLDWVDLQVFAVNAPAVALYRRLGFVEQGRTPDLFRLEDGDSIEDIRMALRLKR